MKSSHFQVNGERVSPPLSPVTGLKITMNSKEVQLTAAFGLTVKYDGSNRGGTRRQILLLLKWMMRKLVSNSSFPLEIILPSTYRNSVRGLCGNYDGITRNEYMKPDGTVVRTVNAFGDSWRITDRQSDGLRSVQVPHSVHRWDPVPGKAALPQI